MIQHIKKDFTALSVIYALAVIFLIVISLFAVPIKLRQLGIFVPEANVEERVDGFNIHAFDGVSVKAKSYIVYDVITGKVIAGKNETTPYPLASITKIMTALTALDVASTSQKITVTKGSLDEGYDLGLSENQVWRLGELLKYTLVFSSNDGAQLIADKLLGRSAFIAKMNSYSDSLGFSMRFTQPAGLDVDGKLGGVGSALDVARMMSLARVELGNVLDSTTKTRARVNTSTGALSGIPNTNQFIDEIVGAEASKTGYTDIAGGNLVLSIDATLGHPVIIVVLGSTRDERFTDAYALYKALKESIK